MSKPSPKPEPRNAISLPDEPLAQWQSYSIHSTIELNNTNGKVRLWMPLAQYKDTLWQRSLGHNWQGNFETAGIYRDPVAEMEVFYADWPEGTSHLKLQMTSQVATQNRHFDITRRGAMAERTEVLRRCLQSTEFVPLDGRRVLAILVFADNDVQNRVIEPRRAFDPSELERVSNYLNQNFAGRPLSEIRATLLHDLRHAQAEMEGLLAHTVELAEHAFVPAGDDMVLAGQTRLMGVQDLSDLDRLRELFETFARKREILQLLERTLQAPGVRIFIGEETGLAPLDGVSVVTAPYMAGGQVLGVLGVIGPKRMAYERVIPVVQAAADALGSALNPDA